MACNGCNGAKSTPVLALPNVQAGAAVVTKSLAAAPCPCKQRDWYDWILLAAVVIGALYALDRIR